MDDIKEVETIIEEIIDDLADRREYNVYEAYDEPSEYEDCMEEVKNLNRKIDALYYVLEMLQENEDA